jgi:hypothetical protein
MSIHQHSLSFRQRRRLRIAALASVVFALSSFSDLGAPAVVLLALFAQALLWRVWEVRHDDPREGWRC